MIVIAMLQNRLLSKVNFTILQFYNMIAEIHKSILKTDISLFKIYS